MSSQPYVSDTLVCRMFGKLIEFYFVLTSFIRFFKYNAETGERQGDPMSSNLFDIYINDLPSFVNEGKDIDVNSDSNKFNVSHYRTKSVTASNSFLL